MLPNSVRKTGTFGRVGYTYLLAHSPTGVYVSEACGSTSSLDHCVATKEGNTIITSISVDYDDHLSDNFPMNINVCCDLAPKLEERCSNRTQKIDGAKASQRDMPRYTTRADVLLRDMQNMHHELVGCTDMNCHNINHIAGIEKSTTMIFVTV